MKSRITIFFCVIAAFVSPSVNAHFIWLVPEAGQDGAATVHVYFGEDATDTGSEFLSYVQGVKVQRVVGKKPATAVELKSAKTSLTASADLTGNAVVVASHDLGVMDRGDSVFRLKYYAKTGGTIPASSWAKAVSSDDLRLDVVPVIKGTTVTVTVYFDGKPAAGAQVTAARPGMDDFEGDTGDSGTVTFDIAEDGMHSIRARHVEKVSGEVDGKKYPEVRHYSTAAVSISTSGSSAAVKRLQPLPQPVTSFGAAVVGQSLYMYGGHTGSAHSYSKEEQSNELTRLNLKTGEWKTVIDGPHLQGLALVTHGGKLYRIGGFTAMNGEGDDHNLQSQDFVACFDPETGDWQQLPSLPEPRSSHDAAVVGDAIYVVGGWAMGDADENHWHKTACKLDLTRKDLKWETIAEPPFQRRALAAAAHGDKLYVVGGMQQKGGPTTAVAVFDTTSNTWSEGPSLFVKEDSSPDAGKGRRRGMSSGRMAGFGASAFATGGHLYVTTVQGNLQQLSDDGTKWTVVAEGITPRFFHRLLPLSDNQLVAVGGANMSIGKFDEVEVIDVQPGT